MHTYQRYDDPSKTREQHDEQAIRDLMDWLSPQAHKAVEQMLAEPTYTVQHINMALGFAGVSGRPFFALMRKHRLEEFRAWCRDDGHGGSRETDEAGFFVDE